LHMLTPVDNRSIVGEDKAGKTNSSVGPSTLIRTSSC
jgi:hypothetical protein